MGVAAGGKILIAPVHLPDLILAAGVGGIRIRGNRIMRRRQITTEAFTFHMDEVFGERQRRQGSLSNASVFTLRQVRSV